MAPDLDDRELVGGRAVPVDGRTAADLRQVAPDPHRARDLVLLDMDGTLVDGRSSWEHVHHRFGVSNAANWAAYQRGEIDDLEFTRSDIALWLDARGRVHVDEVREALADAPRMPGLADLVDHLRAEGTVTAIVSGGLDLLAREVARETGIDLVAANGVGVDDDGHLDGSPRVRVPIRDKATTTRAILDDLGVDPDRAAAVGNSRYDAGMFREVGRGIAFAPDDEHVQAAADAVVHARDLRRVIAHL